MSISEEDTYSMMFASLKHPIRRRILRILSNGPETFTDLLNEFKIESSHLTYHLEGLGNLLVKTEDGKYALSSLGEAAVSTMKRVEEPPTTATHLSYPSTRQLHFIKPLTILLICALIASLLFSAAFLFRNAELDKAYGKLEKTYSELNNTYDELSNAYDRLNRTYNQLNSAFQQLNRSFQELNEAYYELNRSYFSHMPRELTFQTIEQGGAIEVFPAYYIIQNQSSWVDMWNKRGEYAVWIENGSRVVFVPPEVNFSESIVIAVFMGSGGLRIEVKEICDAGKYVLVKVEQTYPGTYCAMPLMISYPYHIVKTYKTDKPIIFDTIERTMECPPF